MYAEIASNKRKTFVIMGAFIVFVAALTWLLGAAYGSPSLGYSGLIFAVCYALFTYFAGSRLSLAMNGAHKIQKSDNPRLWRTVENLAITNGLPMPQVYVIDDPAPNAFATGRNPSKASVCATTGLLEIMDDQELEGVMAHELGHVQNYDMRVNMIAFALSAVISVLADIILRMTWFRDRDDDNNSSPVLLVAGIVAALVAPLIATLIQLAISRQREYLADATGALTTRYPTGLANALRKIEAHGSALKHQNTATAHFFFANPLKGRGLTNMFSTHPPLADRIARLENINTHA